MKDPAGLLEIMVRTAIEAGEKTLLYYHHPETILKADHSPLTRADIESNQIINSNLSSTGIPVISEENKTEDYANRRKWNIFWLVDPLDGTKEFVSKSSEYTINIALVENGDPVAGVVYAPALRLLYYGAEDMGSFKAVIPESFKDLSKTAKIARRISVGHAGDRLRIVASKSHLTNETRVFIERIKECLTVGHLKTIGSSLKLCMIAEGNADIYPRLGPTMEWDTAASHAIVKYAGGLILRADNAESMVYNKPDLLNPWFVVCNPELETVIRKIISTG